MAATRPTRLRSRNANMRSTIKSASAPRAAAKSKPGRALSSPSSRKGSCRRRNSGRCSTTRTKSRTATASWSNAPRSVPRGPMPRGRTPPDRVSVWAHTSPPGSGPPDQGAEENHQEGREEGHREVKGLSDGRPRARPRSSRPSASPRSSRSKKTCVPPRSNPRWLRPCRSTMSTACP